MGRRSARRAGLALAAVALGLAACSSASEGDQAAFCERLDRLQRNDPFEAFGDQATPAEIEIAFTALRDRAQELLDVAPQDVRAAARDYRDAVRALDDLLAGAAYGTDVDAAAYREQQVAYTEAAQRLERYLRAEC